MGSVVEKPKKQRIEWIDVMRCIAMYLVVLGHANPKRGTPDTYGYYIYSFHMPLFFMISGGAYYLQTKSKSFQFMDMVKNKTKALIWPYFTLNIIAFGIWILNFKILSHRSTSLWEVVAGIFYSNENVFTAPSNATWFLLTLFLTTVAFYIAQLWSKNDEKILTLLIMVVASFGYSISLREDKFQVPWHIETVPMALLLFLMGYLFIKHLDFMMELLGNRKRQIGIFVFCLFAGFCCAACNVKISMAVNTYGSFVLFLGSVISFSIVCMLISMWIPKCNLFKFIGRNTIVYLAFHAPMLRFMIVYSETTKWLYDEHPILSGTIVFILLIPIAWVFEKYLPFLLGRKKKVFK